MASGNGNRSTMRMTFADLSRMAGHDDEPGPPGRDGPGTIYYLKTSTPHLYDISVSGPYKDLRSVYSQASYSFGRECQPGRALLLESMANGQPIGFEHVESPINGNPNEKRRIQLIRKTNPTLAARLPCPVWNVMRAEIATDATAMGPTGPNGDAVPVEDMEILGSFESEAPATEAARTALRDIAGPGDITRTMQDSPFTAGVIDTRTRLPVWIVMVHRDDGVVTPRG